ncbi:hypothetical protein MARU1_000295 [Malassezia arunalokei]|nr:hypothetical protein MARU1_000295 [Malassezia arunalokei]
MKIPSEHLVLGVFGAIGAAAYAGMSGGSSKKEKPSVDKVPLNAESADEEAFIKQFLAEAAKEDSK